MKLLHILIAVTVCAVSVNAQGNLYFRRTDPVNEYYRVPLMFSPSLHFSGMVENIGDSAAINVQVNARVYNSAATVVYNANSVITPSLNAGDSIAFSIASFQLPTVMDEYIVKYTTTMSGTDPDTSDNVILLIDSFYVTDSVFARDNNNPYVSIAAGGNADGFLGQQFVLTQPAMLTSVSAHLAGANPCDIAFVLFPYNNGSPGYVPIATSDTFTLGPAPQWVTFAMQSPIYLAADTFVLAAQQFGAVYIDLSQSDGNYTPGSSWGKWQGSGGWHNLEFYGNQFAYPFMLRANLTAATAVGDSLHDNVSISVSPNPGSGTFLLDYNFGENSDALISIYNAAGQSVYFQQMNNVASGIITLELGAQPAGIYFVEVIAGMNRKTLEIIVE